MAREGDGEEERRRGRGYDVLFCPFWPFLENSKSKNLLLNVFVQFFSVFFVF